MSRALLKSNSTMVVITCLFQLKNDGNKCWTRVVLTTNSSFLCSLQDEFNFMNLYFTGYNMFKTFLLLKSDQVAHVLQFGIIASEYQAVRVGRHLFIYGYKIKFAACSNIYPFSTWVILPALSCFFLAPLKYDTRKCYSRPFATVNIYPKNTIFRIQYSLVRMYYGLWKTL